VSTEGKIKRYRGSSYEGWADGLRNWTLTDI